MAGTEYFAPHSIRRRRWRFAIRSFVFLLPGVFMFYIFSFLQSKKGYLWEKMGFTNFSYVYVSLLLSGSTMVSSCWRGG